jgi:hypothetical protein
VPAGNVTFFDGTVPLGTAALKAASATLSTAAMQLGQHTLHTLYSGDAVYASSTSSVLTQTVIPAPDFTISIGSNSYSGNAGKVLSIPITILPVNGTLNHTVSLSISGLPPGATAHFTPSIFTLGGDPADVSLAVTLPATLSRGTFPGRSLLACGIGAVLLLCPFRRLRSSICNSPVFALICLGLAMVCAAGCGGGFRTATSTGTDGTTRTLNYTAIVTATSTGVMGEVLTHTATVGLVITQ